jgi:AcrR family transcriptional regulator
MRADARRNRERLLAAARVAFSEHGTNASLDDIARRAGLGSGTLYRHFPTRHALLEAVAADAFARLRREADELLEAAEPHEALVTWLRALIEYTTTVRGLAGALMACQGDESSALQPPCQLIDDTMAALLARAQAAGAVQPHVQPEDLGRLAYGIALTSESGPEGGELVDRLLALTVEGLRPRAPSSATAATDRRRSS